MYENMIKDQLNKRVNESVDDNTIKGKLKHYIPHYGIITPNKNTAKLQIVYDTYTKT